MKENQDLASIIRNNILLFAIYLYFAGWTYAYKYYGDLGINLSSLDIPIYYFFIYSFSALNYGVFLLLLLFVGIYYYYLHHKQMVVCLIIFLIALLPVIYILSYYSATTSAMTFRRKAVTSYKCVKLLVTDKSAIYPFENFSSLNAEGKLKFITSNKDYSYLLYQPKGDNRALPEGYTFKVSSKNIIMTKSALY